MSRTSQAQVLAANVDAVAGAVSLAAPLKVGRVERMLALAWESGATPVVVLTKADRCAGIGEPGCAVLAAVEDGYLTQRRFDSYHRLQCENTYVASRTDARLRAERERPTKHGARLRRALKQSPHFKA
ncbi:GTPase RsgA [Dactylosporangium sp. NPDC000521]|uniref:GTPase RsgA n=1 Tax=Dactylosporangium sp. NPDC000521 TaxID=3363975 RepID=UPI00369A7FE1